MMSDKMEDIRWEQRFANYNKALKKLAEAIGYIKKMSVKGVIGANDMKSDIVLVEIIREGLIQRFEYTYEMAWNVMKDYAHFQGNTEVGGSRDAIRYAFSLNLVSDGDLWMDMVSSRIKTSHTYDEDIAKEIYSKIVNKYYPEFLRFGEVMDAKRSERHPDLFGNQ